MLVITFNVGFVMMVSLVVCGTMGFYVWLQVSCIECYMVCTHLLYVRQHGMSYIRMHLLDVMHGTHVLCASRDQLMH